MKAMTRIFLTGASGEIGRAILESLARENEVMALVRTLPEKPIARVQWVVADLKNVEAYRAQLSGCVALVHAAASTRNRDENELNRTNVQATLELVRAAHAEGIKKIIVFSTAAVTHDWLSPYARSKKEMEKQLLALDFPIVILRPTLVYFPGSRHFANFKKLCNLPLPFIPLPNQGKAQVKPVQRSDVVLAVTAIAKGTFPLQTKIYDLAHSQSCTLEEVMQMVQASMGLRKSIVGYDSKLFSSAFDFYYSIGVVLPSFVASFGAIGSGYRADSAAFTRDYKITFKDPFVEIPNCLNEKAKKN